jgi:hypothetical protein
MPANFQLMNIAALSFTKTITTLFGMGSINQGNATPAVVFTVSKPDSIPVTGLGFTDARPSGLQIQGPNGLSNTCADGVALRRAPLRPV